MKVFHFPQGSAEWMAARMGIPTASTLDALISPTFEVRTGAGPRSFLYEKLAESVTGLPTNDFQSHEMQTGTLLEQEALGFVGLTLGLKCERVGFCTTDDGRVGASPDGLLGEESGLELKCPSPHTHLKYLLEGQLPAEYRAQVHGSMYVTRRKSWYFVSYSRHLPAFVLKVERDETIQARIHEAITGFLAKFDEAKKRIDEMRAAEYAVASATRKD